ncbi:EscU/YscU/HrcU family type III secretion system export apparatus switch protein [Granulicella tundricola]|uniref:Type III secretion exporter n=1 Tax=Granulicella tundricola (strain ATCC BAA-1859 / DSM 23138 / MP5ACTX9) TaxID=1198114 RepID=E8X629_GRATM|nr:EscU/YscU/HrcU family type III secretion system export apparatus switch protein [Granulicella tundricola]ADW70913.1 type III secretion exporter [Granulicella tundricola MP5ACTX9]
MADSNKTEEATPKRRQKAREQGQVARSKELPSVLAIAGAIGALCMMSQSAVTHWTTFYRSMLDTASTSDLESNGPILFWGSVEVFRWIIPVLMSATVLSVAAGLAQGGLSIAPEAMQLKFERFNPASKVGQIFSLAGVSNMLKSLLPFGAIAWIGEACIRSNWGMLIRASSFGLRQLVTTLGGMIFEVAWKSALVLVAWAGVDYLLTWKKMEGDLKMSKEEIKEEYKQNDGNPLIKSRIRRLQRRMRKKQALAAAATATVIVTNPTHYAVALRYTPEMAAPEVVSKGMNLLAQQIKALGAENGIMILENKPLAQALYKTVEVGEVIPSTLYQAVADILVIVFRAQAEVRQQEAMRRNRNASGELVRR